MRSPVIIKGNRYGFQIVLNPDLTFEELLERVAEKFRETGGFFDQNRPMAVSFTGRDLTEKEQDLLVDVITENSKLQISCIIDGAKNLEKDFSRAVSRSSTAAVYRYAVPETVEEFRGREAPAEEEQEYLEEDDVEHTSPVQELFHSEQPTEKNGQFYRGTLRSGQSIEVEGSIVILGDINPGAQVTAGGNVVVLGSLKGIITAGYPSDQSAFVAALSMDPMQIKIGEIIARAPDQKTMKGRKKPKKKPTETMEPKLAFVENHNIFIEPITRSLISEFSSKQPEY